MFELPFAYVDTITEASNVGRVKKDAIIHRFAPAWTGVISDYMRGKAHGVISDSVFLERFSGSLALATDLARQGMVYFQADGSTTTFAECSLRVDVLGQPYSDGTDVFVNAEQHRVRLIGLSIARDGSNISALAQPWLDPNYLACILQDAPVDMVGAAGAVPGALMVGVREQFSPPGVIPWSLYFAYHWSDLEASLDVSARTVTLTDKYNHMDDTSAGVPACGKNGARKTAYGTQSTRHLMDNKTGAVSYSRFDDPLSPIYAQYASDALLFHDCEVDLSDVLTFHYQSWETPAATAMLAPILRYSRYLPASNTVSSGVAIGAYTSCPLLLSAPDYYGIIAYYGLSHSSSLASVGVTTDAHRQTMLNDAWVTGTATGGILFGTLSMGFGCMRQPFASAFPLYLGTNDLYMPGIGMTMKAMS